MLPDARTVLADDGRAAAARFWAAVASRQLQLTTVKVIQIVARIWNQTCVLVL